MVIYVLCVTAGPLDSLLLGMFAWDLGCTSPSSFFSLFRYSTVCEYLKELDLLVLDAYCRKGPTLDQMLKDA